MTRKPKILLLTEWFVPGYRAGGPIRSCVNFAEQMSAHYDIYVLTTNQDYGDNTPYANIQPDTWIRSESNRYSVYYLDKKKAKTISRLIHEVNADFVYLNSMFAFHFSVLPVFLALFGKINSKVVLAPRGMLHEGALQYKSFKKHLYLKFLKWFGASKVLSFHATDDQEKKDVRFFFRKAKMEVASNFTQKVTTTIEQSKKQAGELKLLFISRISPKKNIHFLLEVLAQVSSEVSLTIVGPIEDTAYWDRCRTQIDRLPANIHIEQIGALPYAEISKLYTSHHFFVLPSFGENFAHAIYEAMAHGCPVLISDQTPWKNLEEKEIGWDLSLSDPLLWHQTLQKAINMDKNEYSVLSQKTLEYAKDYSDNSRLIEKYQQLFK